METWIIVLISVFGVYLLGVLIKFFVNRGKFVPLGKHCYVTGGSQGLGKALAIELAKMGANVTIAARTERKLQEAVKEIEEHRTREDQKFGYVCCDVGSADECRRALKEASDKMDKIPEYVFCCAGIAVPGYLLDMEDAVFEQQMNTNYLALRLMAEHQVKGKIIMTSSVAAFIGFIGFSAYSPTKSAIKECLRSEAQLYGVAVHAYFPGTMDSPGLVQENKTKPEITRIIEGDDKISTETAAKGLVAGLRRNQFMISTDFIGELCRIVFPVFVLYADYLVKKEGRRQRQKND